MTLPSLPPAKEPHGRTAKELLGYAGANAGHMDAEISFDARYALPWAIPDQALAPTLYSKLPMEYYDATAATAVRLVVVVAASGSVNARFLLQANPDYVADPVNGWISPGIGGLECAISLVASTVPLPKKSPWITLRSEVRSDCVWRVIPMDGDGATEVQFAMLKAQFRLGPPLAEQTWYLRVGAPKDGPTAIIPSDYTAVDFWGSLGLDGGISGSNPMSPSTPAPAGHLNLTPGNSGGAGASVTPSALNDDTNDHASKFDTNAFHWWVGPPLMAQKIPQFVYRLQFAGEALHASTAGYAVWRLMVWRPGTGIVYTWQEDPSSIRGSWFRYQARGWEVYVQADEMTVLEDDRLVVVLDTLLDHSGGILSNGGNGPTIFYNGAGNVNVGTFQAGVPPKSHIVMPKLVYKTPFAT